MTYKTTAEIKVPAKLIDQIIGQNNAIAIIKKAALQRRHVLLIGEPGTGKSLLGQALAELLKKEKLVDVLVFHNEREENEPLVRTMPKGKGRELTDKLKAQNATSFKAQNIIFFALIIITVITPWWVRKQYGDIMAAASLIGSMIFLAAFVIFMNLAKRMGPPNKLRVPKLLIDNAEKKKAPFLDATGAHAGALLGDVLHDPLQSLESSNRVRKKGGKKVTLASEVNKLLKKYKNKLITKDTYEAVHTNKDDLVVLAEKNNKPQEVEVLSVNRYKYTGDLIKITTESGKTIITTPEHKIATTSFFGKKKYKRADKFKLKQKLFTTQ